MSKFLVKSKVRLSDTGIAGAVLFVGGALLGIWAASQATPVGVYILAGLACTVGFILLLIGRDYSHDVTIVKDPAE